MKYLFTFTESGKKYFYMLSALLVGLIVLYALFVNQTVINVVERKNVQKSIGVLSTEVGKLESSYIQKKNAISIDNAYALGFHEVENPRYVSRNDSANILTLNDEI